MKKLLLIAALCLAGLARAASDDAPKPPQPRPADAPDQPVVPPTAPVTRPPVAEPPPPPVEKVFGEVNVAGVKLSGLGERQAREKLRDALLAKLDAPVTITDGAKSLLRTRRELAAGLDLDLMLEEAHGADGYVPLKLKVVRGELAAALRSWALEFRFAGRDAALLDRDGTVRVDPGEYQRELDVAATATRIAETIERDAATQKIAVVLHKSPPAVPASTFEGVTGRLGRYTTLFNPEEKDRTENMRVAAVALDGLLMPPGSVFSLNDALGERTVERGYRKARIFEDGRVTEGLGGGVSQVTGTLFNAALFGGLEIVAYRTHSRPVKYLPLGRDATVAWGQFDMKFRNDTPAPVYIRCGLEARRVVCTLYGRITPGRKVTVEVTSTQLGPQAIDAVLLRTISVRGRPVAKETIGRSHYEWKPDETPPPTR
jgi:vancomycin resistance protein YoaR